MLDTEKGYSMLTILRRLRDFQIGPVVKRCEQPGPFRVHMASDDWQSNGPVICCTMMYGHGGDKHQNAEHHAFWFDYHQPSPETEP